MLTWGSGGRVVSELGKELLVRKIFCVSYMKEKGAQPAGVKGTIIHTGIGDCLTEYRRDWPEGSVKWNNRRCVIILFIFP